MSIKFPPAILGRKWLRQFYGRLAFFGSFCRKTPIPIKFLLSGGVLGFFLEGGVEVPILVFMGVGIFPTISERSKRLYCRTPEK